MAQWASSTRPPCTLASHLFRGAGRGLIWSRTLLNDFCNETQLRARPGRLLPTDEARKLLLLPRDERRLATPVFRGVGRAPLRTRSRRRVTPGVARGCDADTSCAFHEWTWNARVERPSEGHEPHFHGQAFARPACLVRTLEGVPLLGGLSSTRMSLVRFRWRF